MALTQTSVSIGSGEAEFYGIVYGAVMALCSYHLYVWRDDNEDGSTSEEQEADLYSDPSAGHGAATRFGVGKRPKHIETEMMFMQGVIAARKVNVREIGCPESG